MMLLLGLLLTPVLGFVPVQEPQVLPKDRTPVFLQLVGEDGQPFTEVGKERNLRLGFMSSSGGMGLGSFEWPASPQVFCAPVRQDVLRHPRLPLEEPLSAALQTGPGLFRFLLEPGFTYSLGVRGGAVPCLTTEVKVPFRRAGTDPKPIRCELTVRVKEIEQLRIQLLDPAGNPIAQKVAFQVEDIKTGLPLVSRRRITSAEQTIGLPRGSYRVRAYNREDMYFCGHTLFGSITLGGGTGVVSTTPTTQPAQWLRLDGGGKILVNLSDLPLPSRHEPADIELVLLPVEGWSFRPEFVTHGSTTRSMELLTFLQAGGIFTSELVPAGRYQLIAQRHRFSKQKDGRIARLEIEVREGETTEAILLFSQEGAAEEGKH